MNTREDVIKHKFHETIMVTVAVPFLLIWSYFEMQGGGFIPMFVFAGCLHGFIVLPYVWITRWWVQP